MTDDLAPLFEGMGSDPLPIPYGGVRSAGAGMPDIRVYGKDVSRSAREVMEAAGVGTLSGLVVYQDEVYWVPAVSGDNFDLFAARELGRPLTSDALLSVLLNHANCYKVVKSESGAEKEYPALPTAGVAKVVLQRASVDAMKKLRRVDAVTRTPVLRTDGSVLDTPGYDIATRLLYLPHNALDGLDIPEDGTEEEVRAAGTYLLSLISDYPFDNEDSRANYIAMMLAPLLVRWTRQALPTGLITAPSRGSGKTYLAQGLINIHGGVITVETKDEDEARKTVQSILDVGAGVGVFDNIKGHIGGGVFEMLATSYELTMRILGLSKSATYQNNTMWVLTANNPVVTADAARRMLVVRLDPGMEKPYIGRTFEIADWTHYIEDHRAEIIRALLVVASAGVKIVDSVGVDRTDSFSKFVQVAQACLQVAGIPGRVMSVGSVDDISRSPEDDFDDFLHAVHAWLAASGGDRKFLAREVADEAFSRFGAAASPEAEIMLEMMPEFIHASKNKARSLASWMAKWRDSPVGGLVLTQPHKDRKWAIRESASGCIRESADATSGCIREVEGSDG